MPASTEFLEKFGKYSITPLVEFQKSRYSGNIGNISSDGTNTYVFEVAVPSLTLNLLDRSGKLTYNYYTYPFEAEANLLRGSRIEYIVKRPALPDGGYTSYWDLILMFFN